MMAWLKKVTQDNYDSGLLDITPILDNVTSGKVWLRIRNGWVWVGFLNVRPSVGGTVFTTAGLLPAAPAVPLDEADAAMVAQDGTSRRVVVNRLGQLRGLGLNTTDILNGQVMWPMMRPVPVTIPGVN